MTQLFLDAIVFGGGGRRSPDPPPPRERPHRRASLRSEVLQGGLVQGDLEPEVVAPGAPLERPDELANLLEVVGGLLRVFALDGELLDVLEEGLDALPRERDDRVQGLEGVARGLLARGGALPLLHEGHQGCVLRGLHLLEALLHALGGPLLGLLHEICDLPPRLLARLVTVARVRLAVAPDVPADVEARAEAQEAEALVAGEAFVQRGRRVEGHEEGLGLNLARACLRSFARARRLAL